MNDDQRQLEEQRSLAERRRNHSVPRQVASLGAVAVEWVGTTDELLAMEKELSTLARRRNMLADSKNRLTKQAGALETAYRSLIDEDERAFGGEKMSKEMRGMAEWTRETLAKRAGGDLEQSGAGE